MRLTEEAPARIRRAESVRRNGRLASETMNTSSRPIRFALAALVFASAVLLAGTTLAGLRFTPVPGPEGADTSALAGDGTTLWAGTLHGVWRLESGTWSFDGLGEKTVLSIALSGGSVWAATGDGLWRRSTDGTWSFEPLPGNP